MMKQTLLLLMLSSLLLAGDFILNTMQTGQDACMVVLEQKEENYIIMNEARAAIRFSPFSTHKIPHSLIALETGVIPDVETALTWDAEKYPEEDWWPETWKGEHNLRSAIKVSLVPAYRQIASEVGSSTMKYYLTSFDYGNADVSSGVDSYWLNGSLKISAMEQVNFLQKFYDGKLKLKDKTTRSVMNILVQEETDHYRLSYKTGTGTIDPETGRALAWLVGYIEKEGQVYFFAFNMEAENFTEAVELRMKTARTILTELGLLE